MRDINQVREEDEGRVVAGQVLLLFLSSWGLFLVSFAAVEERNKGCKIGVVRLKDERTRGREKSGNGEES